MMEEQEKLDLSIYFMSQAHKCVFALCYLDKGIRMELLGITEELYEDKEKAKEIILWQSQRMKQKKDATQ